MGKFQEPIGSFVARRRTPKITEQYKAIDGGSPIAHWTHEQGQSMIAKLTALCGGGATSPQQQAALADWFNYYISFRYAPPLTEQALLKMKADGVERAIAFSQYPQVLARSLARSLATRFQCRLHELC
jgi:ferrochelatase